MANDGEEIYFSSLYIFVVSGIDHNQIFVRIYQQALAAPAAFEKIMVLIYPVITMREEYTHQGSSDALLGSNPDQIMVDYFSNELQVKASTPSTFIIHSTDDTAVPVENSLLFYQALKRAGITSEMHIFPTGGHGYSLALNDDHLRAWSDLLIKWLKRTKQ